MRTSGVVHQPVPVPRLVVRRRPCPHQGQRLCDVFTRGRGGSWKLAGREGAFGVALAAEEHGPAPTAAANELALTALGARHAGLFLRLLDVLAVRVAGAA